MAKTEEFSGLRFFLTLGILIAGGLAISFVSGLLLKKPGLSAFPTSEKAPSADSIAKVNRSFSTPVTPEADFYTIARRLSLSLTGSVPSLEELRRLEATAPEDRLNAWLDHLFADQRYAQYLAERFARVYVGVEPGPFLVYRRRRMVNWLADQLAMNRPYDDMARELIASKGIWTTSPAANFITVTNIDGGKDKGGPDEIRLAARTSRAFLGVSLDCVQCHDDKFGDRWKQKDFHQLAAFFAQSEVGVTGVRDNPERDYEARFKGKREVEPVSMKVPFQEEIFSEQGMARDQLANWITHSENRSFSRAVANRAWALLTGRPLMTPIDDIPIEGEVHPALERLADAFVESDHDLQALLRLIANSAPFRSSSTSGDPANPVTEAQEKAWGAFPVTQLRPEQVAGSVIQAASIQALDSSAHIFKRMQRYAETNDFVKRFGDKGESEFTEGTGTIPQRLILMNGKLIKGRTEPNPLFNATTRISSLCKTNEKAVETAFLCALTRLPNDRETAHFTRALEGKKGDARQRALYDLFWVLMNSTEFSWNR